MIDRQVENFCVQAMTVQEFKSRGGATDNHHHHHHHNIGPSDILSPSQEILDNEKDNNNTTTNNYRLEIYPQPQDSEHLLGRVLAGKQ